MNIYTSSFKPTYLYIKEHKLTGLKYFGKTTGSLDYLLNQYKGGGKYWNNHLRKHGKEHVITPWYCLFTERDKLVEFALKFSEENNIVHARDPVTKKKIWANHKPENGLDGGNEKGHNKGKKNPKISAALKGKSKPDGFGAKVSIALTGTIFSAERCANISAGKKGKKNPAMLGNNYGEAGKGIPKPTFNCPHCEKVIGGQSNFNRWHGDNCKQRIK